MKLTRVLFLSLASLTLIIVGTFTTVVVETKAPLSVTPFSATCFCKISKNNLAGQISASGVIKDLTAEVNKSYTGIYQQSEENQELCKSLCKDKVDPYINSQSIAVAACAAGAPDESWLQAYSAVGNRPYRQVLIQSGNSGIGSLTHKKEVTQTTCKCPPTWAADSTNVLGGVTTNGLCKKPACQGINVTPLPPNGTKIGTWGFTWGNEIIAYGSSANGGAPTCVTTVTQAGICGICCGAP